jgi:hypothetical protein
MVLDSELNGGMLLAIVDSLFENRDKLEKMGRLCGGLYRAGAAAVMYEHLLKSRAGKNISSGSAA